MILLHSTLPFSERALKTILKNTLYVDWLPVRVTYTVPVVRPKQILGDSIANIIA